MTRWLIGKIKKRRFFFSMSRCKTGIPWVMNMIRINIIRNWFLERFNKCEIIVEYVKIMRERWTRRNINLYHSFLSKNRIPHILITNDITSWLIKTSSILIMILMNIRNDWNQWTQQLTIGRTKRINGWRARRKKS